jgi:signal transduction histidine kinase
VLEEITPSLKPGQKISFEAPSMHIQTDPRILRNILFNLLSNASKYSDGEKKILVYCTLNDTKLSISVTDQGIGIPDNELKHMFERFFRASNAVNIQGTGLGLNIVKRYIDLLNGRINFKSEYGKGSTFTVTIPIQ